MKKHAQRRSALLKLALGLGLASATLVPSARAAFQNPLLTPQASAMGGASLGSLGDPSALFLNPAAVSGLKTFDAYVSYSQLFAGLNGVDAIGQTFVAAGVPTRAGALSVGFGDFSAAGLLNERVAGVSFARRLFGAVDAGVTAKFLSRKYQTGSDPAAAADPVFRNGNSRGAFSFDAGLAMPLGESLTAGAAARNINSPDVGLATPDRVPREYQAGLAYRWRPWGVTATADYLYRDVPDASSGARNTPSVGLEKTFADGILALRAGASPDQFAGGIGVRFGSFGFDYAFLLPRELATAGAGTHQVGIRYRFGGTQ